MGLHRALRPVLYGRRRRRCFSHEEAPMSATLARAGSHGWTSKGRAGAHCPILFPLTDVIVSSPDLIGALLFCTRRSARTRGGERSSRDRLHRPHLRVRPVPQPHRRADRPVDQLGRHALQLLQGRAVPRRALAHGLERGHFVRAEPVARALLRVCILWVLRVRRGGAGELRQGVPLGAQPAALPQAVPGASGQGHGVDREGCWVRPSAPVWRPSANISTRLGGPRRRLENLYRCTLYLCIV